MKKRRKHAKALVMQPLFRLRQETPEKGKGSYRRQKARKEDCGPFALWGHALRSPAIRHRLFQRQAA